MDETDLPSSFGKQDQSGEFSAEGRYERAQRPEFKWRLKPHQDNEKSGSDDSSGDNDDEIDDLPTTHELVLKGHQKRVTSISSDSSGTRIVTGSYDGTSKFWDFGGMDSVALNSFRSIEPVESHGVRKSLFSPSGNQVLTISQSLKPKLYSRDGKDIAEFASGYIFLVDKKKTKGHTADLTDGCWNPVSTNDREFCTSSLDSTIRIWDVNNLNSHKSIMVVKPYNQGYSAANNKVTAVSWASDGSTVIGSSIDGSVTFWDVREGKPLLRPSKRIAQATEPGTWTSSICPTPGSDNMVAIRGGDDTVKIWDARNLNNPVLQRTNLPSNESINLTYSPDGSYLLTGTADGHLRILDKDDLSDIQNLKISALDGSSVTSVYWHPKLNQIFSGLQNGSVHILFNRNTSNKGAKTVIERAPKVRHVEDTLNTTDISLYGLSEDAFEQQKKRKEHQQRKRQNETISEPAKPSAGVWGTPDEEHIKQNVELSSLGMEDPRDALLKYAEKAEKDPPGYLSAYKKTQPKKIFENDDNDDDNEPPTKKSKNQ